MAVDLLCCDCLGKFRLIIPRAVRRHASATFRIIDAIHSKLFHHTHMLHNVLRLDNIIILLYRITRFLFLDWRSVRGDNSKQRAKKKPNIYERMKKTIRLPISESAALCVLKYVVGDTVEECKQNIESVNAEINKAKYKLIEYHCMMAYKSLSSDQLQAASLIGRNAVT